uniref:Uncharacterized protein n=1 Tax=Trichogramma kaykai TaxID=54128 RepID=A0ABD2XKY2_9HYME
MKFSLLYIRDTTRESQESVSGVRISCASDFVSSSVRPPPPSSLMTSFLIVTFSVLASETTLLLLPRHIYGGTKYVSDPSCIFAGYLQKCTAQIRVCRRSSSVKQIPKVHVCMRTIYTSMHTAPHLRSTSSPIPSPKSSWQQQLPSNPGIKEASPRAQKRRG